MHRLLLVWLLMGLADLLAAQNQPYTLFFPYNWTLLNPAMVETGLFAGRSDDRPTQMVTLRTLQYWDGPDYSPKSVVATYENTPKDQPFRLGGYGSVNQAGAFRNYRFYGNFTYFLRLPNSRSYVHLGFSVGAATINIDRDQLLWSNPNDPRIQDLDPRKGTLDAAFGVVYRFAFGDVRHAPAQDHNYAYIGLSVPGLAPNQFVTQQNLRDKIRATGAALTAGVRLEGADQDARIVWEPFLWLRYTPPYTFKEGRIPLSVDVNVRTYMEGGLPPLWFGAGYSSNGFLRVEAGWCGEPRAEAKKRFRVGTSLSLPAFAKQGVFGPSFELTSAYVIN
jgi:type IX secretion system PorP/SprF family membrane protein